jgi:hypothetical protein
VFALLSLAALASALPRVAAVLVLAVMSWCGWFQLGIDSRYSPKDFATHGHGENWHRLKSPEAWSDVWYALRRQTPPHVLAMPIDSMGNIDQLFRVLEISRAPLADTWYIGRDIGRVGHYAPELKVFDTDGLFTPAAVGTADHVSADAARRAFRLRPIATDLLDGWQVAVGRIIHELGDYRLAFGSRFRPHVLVRRATPPLPAQVLERYARASERLPRSFFLATLYGESVGAAIERRHDWVRRQLSGRRSFGVAQAPPALPGAGVEFDGVVRLHGCRTTHSQVAPGRAVELACYFEAVGAVARDYRVFVHWTDDSGAHVASSDHRPCGGFLPATEWSPGAIVEDRFEASFRPELAGKRLRARLGLFEGDHRARARPLASTDGHDRVHGPELVVIR